MTRQALLAATFLTASFAAGPLMAEVGPNEKAAARALFEEARTLASSGNYSAACPKFAESQRMAPGAGTLFNLADCYEQIGRTASAWSLFLDVAAQEKAHARLEREAVARARAAALESKLSRLVISVPAESEVPALLVRRNGVEVGKGMWGTSVPVDPGEYLIEVSVPNTSRKWSKRINVIGTKPVSLSVPPLPPEAAPGSGASALPVAGAPSASDSHSPSADSSSSTARSGSTQRTLSYVAAGLGVVGVGACAIFGLKTQSRLNDSKDYCNGSACWDQRGVTARDDAWRNGNISTIFGGVGIAALAGATVLYLTAPSDRPKDSPSTASAKLGLSPTGVSIQGSW